MYAIFEDGGKQYRVKKGDTVYVEKREIAANAKTLEFDRVLMVGDGAKSKIGTPVVTGAKITARIESAAKAPKVHIVKFRRRKNYRRHTGHRQNYLKVTIDTIAG